MTLAIDFDGVIHAYSKGWHDGTIYDPPVEGSITGVRCLMQYDACFIHTTRDPEQVVPWLQGHGLDATADDRCTRCTRIPWCPECPMCQGTGRRVFWDERGQLLVTSRKLPALAYLDDRAVRFTDWEQALADLSGGEQG
ncbi:hypothetical protein [Streptomyces chartreusis]|uniref:hypothetical protein n=1 Tax=Streptomyces chartreusis TaxID=1969 RepID=UPI0035E2F972